MSRSDIIPDNKCINISWCILKTASLPYDSYDSAYLFGNPAVPTTPYRFQVTNLTLIFAKKFPTQNTKKAKSLFSGNL